MSENKTTPNKDEHKNKSHVSQKPREGWADAFKRMHENGDDAVIGDNNLDADLIPEYQHLHTGNKTPVKKTT
ncbi:MAG: hypothetical protein P4N59_18995 [Negativicutes bacterium]|nr:hypothetical protein [Negativicutes bacterium]